MPFCCGQGGWVEAYNGREIPMCFGRVSTYNPKDVAYQRTIHEGSADLANRAWNTNSDPLFRVQTHDFTLEMWQWFMDTARYRMGCCYKEDGSDVYMTKPGMNQADAYPMWVLKQLVKEGEIQDTNTISLIERREKEEAALGAAPLNREEIRNTEEVEKIKKEEIAKAKLDEMKSVIDPNNEFSQSKKKEKAKA